MLDAIMVVPGIMGSELRDSEGRVVWGANPSVLSNAWLKGSMFGLQVTPDELEQGSRLTATRLLQAPAWAPFLHGLLPYSRLVNKLKGLCGNDARAVRSFPYDWRMAIDTHTADLLDACHHHLTVWKKVVRNEGLGDPSRVRLVIVAHSMGGLLARLALADSSLAAEVRLLITLGTPYFGSINALEMLATGNGDLPVPEEAALRLARTCPGVYDLLPRYKCVRTAPRKYRMLTTSDISGIGDVHLARAAQQRWKSLDLLTEASWPTPFLHVPVAGANQPTAASVSLNGGTVEPSSSLNGSVDYGDSTVWRKAAAPLGSDTHLITQKHMALAVTAQALDLIEDKVLNRDSGPPLGTRPIGVRLPHTATAGREVSLTVLEQPGARGAQPGTPIGISATSKELTYGKVTHWGPGRSRDGTVVLSHPGLSPGLHQVSVRAGGFEPVTEIILVGSPA